MTTSELAERGVRFKSTARVDSESLKEVATRSYLPYTIFAHVFSALIVCFGLIWYLTGGQIVVLIGLCVGHDTLFLQHSAAPTTVLIAKDRVLGHNPVQALYLAKTGYSRFKKELGPGQ